MLVATIKSYSLDVLKTQKNNCRMQSVILDRSIISNLLECQYTWANFLYISFFHIKIYHQTSPKQSAKMAIFIVSSRNTVIHIISLNFKSIFLVVDLHVHINCTVHKVLLDI